VKKHERIAAALTSLGGVAVMIYAWHTLRLGSIHVPDAGAKEGKEDVRSREGDGEALQQAVKYVHGIVSFSGRRIPRERAPSTGS